MNKPLQFKRLFSFASLVVFFSILFAFPNPDGQNRSGSPQHEKIILVLINTKYFSCPLCQTLFNDFCKELFLKDLERFALGVFIPHSMPDSMSAKNIAILEKQLRGFIQGNSIRFPVILDRDQIFSDLAGIDTDVIFINEEARLMKKYKFPLAQDQWQEMTSDGRSEEGK
ncbi:MAG: hypothetical protein WCC00_13990 [Candidatus Aminicenantales bacterium]